MDWLKFTAVPGDKVSLITFAHDIREDGTTQFGTAERVREWVVTRIEIRPPPSGAGATKLRGARLAVLKAAHAADHGSHVVVTMLFSDRASDDTGGQPETGRHSVPEPEFLARFGGKLRPYEAGSSIGSIASGDPEGVESLAFYKIAKSPDDVRVYCFYSVSAGADAVAREGSQKRYIPGPGGDPKIHERPAVLRTTLARVFWVLLAITGIVFIALLIGCLRDNCSATIVVDENTHRTAWWPPWKPKNDIIRASANALGMRLNPVRPDLGDPAVAHIEINPWSLKPWPLVIKRFTDTAYKLRARNVSDDRARWREQLVLNDFRFADGEPEQHVIDVNSPSGEVARGQVEYRINDRLMRRIKLALAFGIALLVVAVLGPTAIALSPKPKPLVVTPPDREPLCNTAVSLHGLGDEWGSVDGEAVAEGTLVGSGRRLASHEDSRQTHHLRGHRGDGIQRPHEREASADAALRDGRPPVLQVDLPRYPAG
ncbi:MAG TPA: hypothetical protein QGH10_26125, partial [Armatimonadota bacterium]|nr:hypothetical protein [Armatimonadota bacterium]